MRPSVALALLTTLSACSESLVSPKPSLEGIDPALVCAEQLTTPLTVTGAGLAPLPTDVVAGPASLKLPELRLEPVSAIDGGDATASTLDLAGLTTWVSSGEMTFEVTPELGVGVGVFDLVVTNPDGQEASIASGLAAAAAPVLTSVEPEVFCADEEAVTLTLTGEGFLVVGGVLPTVTIGTFVAPAEATGACVPLAGPVEGELCGELTVTVPAGGIEPGAWDLTVTNPDPAGCSTADALPIEVVGAPVIDLVDPAGTCTEAAEDIDLTLTGSGFLSLDGQLPTVTLGDLDMSPVTLDGCTPLTVGDGERCATLSFTVPGGTFTTEGDQTIVVTNPPPADCSVEAIFTVQPPPVVTALEPPQICDDGTVPQLVSVIGEHFADGYTVTLTGGTPTTTVEVPTTFVSETELVGDVSGTPAGLYEVGVVGPGGCVSSDTLVLEVVEEPLVFFVDPPVVYQDTSLVATVFVSGIHVEVTAVSITEVATGIVTPVTFVYEPTTPTLVYVTLPAGLPAGLYDVTVSDAATCMPTLEDAFEVDGTLDLTLIEVDPAFGWTNTSTAIAVTADPASGFVDVPRVYLADAAGGGTAIALDAVTFQDPALLDAVVPPLPVGAYDVIVVNPSGEIGRLPGAYLSVVDPPPVIDSVAPASVASDIDHQILITGTNFRGPEVALECVDPVGAVSFAVNNVVVNGSTPTSVVATIPSSSDPNLRGGAVCVVVVTNDDATFGRYAAISVTNPSQNLYPWQVGSPLTTARTGLVAAAGRSTSVSRWVYAIGGDDGAGTTFDTIERARVDAYGNLGAFEELPNGLPTPVTRAAVATLGRYVYVVGGSNGGALTFVTRRAQILDWLEAPVIDPALVVDVDPYEGLGEGTYIYRVAALFGPNFDDNPSGESLPSDPFVVRLPDATPELLQVTLAWSAVSGAAGYRVYRSDSGSGAEELLAEVPATSRTFTDTGLATDPAEAPLPPGSLGNFAILANMPRALDRPAATIALDPSDPSIAYLYVAGGRDGSGNLRDEVLYLPLTIVGEHDHDAAAAWSTSTRSLAAGRFDLQGRALTSALHSLIPAGDTWIYFGPGIGAGGADVARVDAMRPGPGGDLVESYDVPGAPQGSGYGFAHASNFLYLFGGIGGGGPVSSGVSAALCATGTGPCNGGPPEPPDLSNWNSLGVSLSVSRSALGSAQESSVIFAVGGDDGAGASTAVDFTNY